MEISLFVFIPLMSVLAVLAVPIVRVVYGERWQGAGEVLAILALGTILWPAHVLNLVAMNAQGRPRLVLQVEIAKKTIAVILLVLSAPHGISTLAWSTVVTSFVAFFLNAWFVGRMMDYGILPQLRVLGVAAIPGAGAALVAWACERLIPESPWDLLTAIPASAIATIMLGALMRHPAIPVIINLLPNLRGMRRG
jgi:O-antigen/teichoic acid export membrane protein